MTPLELFTRSLPSMPLSRIEKVMESLKGSVGGSVKGRLEAAVSLDFRAAIEKELRRRGETKTYIPIS